MAENEIIPDWAKQLLSGINELKSILSNKSPMSDWLNWQQAMDFLGYKETSMRALEKEGKLMFKMIGRRKYIKKQDLETFIESL